MPANARPTGPDLVRHILLALAIAFGLSIAFWQIYGTFVAAGFILWSLLSAAIGVSVGAYLVRNLVWTGVTTAVMRVLIYAIMVQL